MKIRDFSFNLPPEQIAQYPPEVRGTAKLLVLDRKTGEISHKNMQDFPDIVEPGTLVVCNNSRVRKARVFGFSENGGKVEFFFLKPLESDAWLCMVSKAKKQKVGKTFTFPEILKGLLKRLCPPTTAKSAFQSP